METKFFCYKTPIYGILSIVYTTMEGSVMAVCYKRLWKLLIDRDLKKKDLEEMAGVSHYTMNKLTRGENVTIDILCRI